MKVDPEDFEHIGDQFTRGLGQGCGAVLGIAIVIAAVLGIDALVGWLR